MMVYHRVFPVKYRCYLQDMINQNLIFLSCYFYLIINFLALNHDVLYYLNGDILPHLLFVGKTDRLLFLSNIFCKLYNQIIPYFHNIPLLYINVICFPLFRIIVLYFYAEFFLIYLFLF